MCDQPGVFMISLDTEIAWGCFDTVGVNAYEDSYRDTREVVSALCELFEEFEITATWAVVGHLLDDCDGGSSHESVPDPGYERVSDWATQIPCRSGVDRDLWYAPDLVETIKSTEQPQEIGLHGYYHMILDERECNRGAARTEVREATRLAEREDLRGDIYIYPRNQTGYEDVLSEEGVSVYRDRNADWYEHPAVPTAIQKVSRFASEMTMRTPPVVEPSAREGIVSVPGSLVFRPDGGPWKYCPDRSQVRRATRGLERAAEAGRIFHLWTHPFNLASDIDSQLGKLRQILQKATEMRGERDIEIISLGEAATQYRNGRW